MEYFCAYNSDAASQYHYAVFHCVNLAKGINEAYYYCWFACNLVLLFSFSKLTNFTQECIY